MTENNQPDVHSQTGLQIHEQPTASEVSSDREIDLAMLAAAGGIAAASAEIARQVRARILRRQELIGDASEPS